MTDLTALSYTEEHEWVAAAGDVATVGVTDFATEQLGDIVYVDLPSVGQAVTAGAVMGEIESTKSVSELYAPVTGEVVEINADADSDPAIVGDDPFGAGWLVKVRLSAPAEGLLDRAAYERLTGAGS